MRHSRRTFLRQVSAAAAGLGLARRLPGQRLWAASPRDLLTEPDEARLRALALTAVEAARTAGAAFADVRLTVAQYYQLRISSEGAARTEPPFMGAPATGFAVDYGVRALVGGVWGFANGATLTPEAVADTARGAVEAARSVRARHRRALELAPVSPVADGRWTTPVERDPLTVSFGEQRDLGLAAIAEVATVPGVAGAGVTFHWRCHTLVFASTEGMLLVQRIRYADPVASVIARVGPGDWDVAEGTVDLPIGGYGYEAMRPTTLATELRQAAERAVARARAPHSVTSVGLGRYDLVLGPDAVAELLAATVAEALSLERALGYRAHREGTSFAAPPAAMLGRYEIASPLITVQADRSQSHGAATVGWDDEGVKPDDYAIIRDGVIMDYHTNRQTAVELADWYRGRGEPVRSHGCARRSGALWPVVQRPNLTLLPGPDRTTVKDLIADTSRGLYVERIGSGRPDHQVLTAQYTVPPTEVRQIANGKLGAYVPDIAVQFLTPQFWRGLDALGGAATARSVAVLTDEAARDPRQPFPKSTVRAVPARVRRVNVLTTGRTQ